MSLLQETAPGKIASSTVVPMLEEDAPPSTLRTDLIASTTDGGAYSVMVGIGESYFGAYALALGLGAVGAGMIATVPMLVGAVLQLITPWAVRRIGSHRVWVVASVVVQTICLLLLPVAAAFSSWTAGIIAFAAISLYWASGLTGGPPWNTWMEDLVPLRIRTRFFACRARICQMCLLGGFIAGGLALQLGRSSQAELAVFCGIFLVAAVARFVSAWSLAKQSEPSRGMIVEHAVGLREFFSAGGKQSGGRLVLYLLAMQTAAQISGPYFTPFLLREEKVSYVTYMILIGMGVLGKVLALPFWGRVGKRIGAQRLLWVGGLAIIPLSALWIIADQFRESLIHFTIGSQAYTISGQAIGIGCIQLLSGASWAAYELAMALMFLHGIPRSHRTSMLTWYNFGNSAAMVVGSLLGACLLAWMHESHFAYLAVFGLSSFVRVLTIALLVRLRTS